MNRLKIIELLELLKNKQITPEQFTRKINNDGKTVFRVIIHNTDGTKSIDGNIYTKNQLDQLQRQFPADKIINVNKS